MFSRLSSITETAPNCCPKIHKNTALKSAPLHIQCRISELYFQTLSGRVMFRVPSGRVPSHRYSNFLASALEE